ncbi:MAG: 50S ribosomal protein L6 [Candidatus Woesearchaeota archaeon]
MKTTIIEKIAIPEGVNIELVGGLLKVNGAAGSCSRNFSDPKVRLSQEGRELVLIAERVTKREKAKLYSFVSHIRNMIKGCQKKFRYVLKICSGHFPMNVSIQGSSLVVKNFLGEKSPRIVRLRQGVDVRVEGDKIFVESPDIELAGQTAADIELAIRARGKDQRVFQDGIYIVEKGG